MGIQFFCTQLADVAIEWWVEARFFSVDDAVGKMRLQYPDQRQFALFALNEPLVGKLPNGFRQFPGHQGHPHFDAGLHTRFIGHQEVMGEKTKAIQVHGLFEPAFPTHVLKQFADLFRKRSTPFPSPSNARTSSGEKTPTSEV